MRLITFSEHWKLNVDSKNATTKKKKKKKKLGKNLWFFR